MKSRILLVAATIAAAGLGWLLFRPERLFVNNVVDDPFPAPARSGAVAVAMGNFHSVAHRGSGVATVYRWPGGNRVLRLTDFRTSNGPDVRVLLVAASDAIDSETVQKADSVEIGVMKGNIGNQNYAIPAAVDLDRYRAVTIWCRRFRVNFATAPLAPASAGTAISAGSPG